MNLILARRSSIAATLPTQPTDLKKELANNAIIGLECDLVTTHETKTGSGRL